MKKVFAFLMSLSLVFAMTFTAFAEEIKINGNLDLHVFNVYQILKGDQTSNDSTLANITWGSGINVDGFVRDVTALSIGNPATTPFAELASATNKAEKFAEILANYGNDSDVANAIAEIAYDNITTKTTSIAADATSVTLEDGYYLFVDTTPVEGTDEVRNKALLQVTKKADLEISLKTMKPSFEKKVQDNENTPQWGDYADYNIGDAVPFKLTATFPTAEMDRYDAYAITITDNYDVELFDYVDGSAKVFVSGNEREDLAVDTSTDGTIAFNADDIKGYAAVDGNIVVEITYDLTLKTTANLSTVDGFVANTNSAELVFSNDPNATGTGSITDAVNVYTYQVVLNKTDNDDVVLEGVKFTLTNDAGEYLQADGTFAATEYKFVTAADGTIVFKGLDEGTYTLTETDPLPGYNSIAAKEITIVSDADDTSTSAPTTLTVNGETSIDVVNKMGSVLPETGGMGTTLFYVLGGALVVFAGVILVSRKRMEK